MKLNQSRNKREGAYYGKGHIPPFPKPVQRSKKLKHYRCTPDATSLKRWCQRLKWMRTHTPY